MPRAARSALGRITRSAANRVPGASVPPFSVTIADITLSGTTGVANSPAGTVIGTLSPVVTGGSLVNPVISLTSTAGGDFRVLSGGLLQFAVNNVPAGAYSVTAQISADNAATASKSLSVTITSSGTGFGGWPINFTGTAGTAPTGDAALTPSPAGWLLDGAGALVMGGTVSDAAGVFMAPGYLGNGNQDFTFAADTPNRAITIYGVNATGDVLDFSIWPDGSVLLYVVVGGVGGAAGSTVNGVVPSNASSVGVAFSGSTFTFRVNGSNTSTVWTVSTVPGPWRLYLGNLGTNFGTKLTTINSTRPSVESLTINTVGSQISGAPFALSGTYAFGTPTALDYSTDGGATWVAATSPTISGGVYSLSATITAFGSASIRVRDHNNPTVYAISNSFTVSAVATTFSVSLSSTFGYVGDTATLTVTPVSGGWPPGRSLSVTQAVSGLLTIGSFSQPTAGSTTPVVIPVTVATTGGPSLTNITDSGTSPMSSSGADSYTAVAAPAGNGRIRSASGMPTTGLAVNPLTQGAIIYSGIVIAYACLHHSGADEVRVAFGGGQTPPLTPADAAGGSDYTFRLYDAATGGNMFYESAPIAVTANPHLIGGDMTVTNWGAGISSSMALNSYVGDGYTAFSSTISDGSKYLSTVGNIPPDQPGGQTINSKLHATDANPTVLYGGVQATQTGTIYLWVIATSAVSGKVSRWCYPSPITVS